MQNHTTQVPPSANQSYGGLFNQPQNFAIHNSTLYSIDYHRTETTSVLEYLINHSMLDARYDSSARDPPPRCHPGTRTNLVESLQATLQEPNSKAKLIWLHGPAGVGKSAVLQTLAEAEAERGNLGATLFFSRSNHRDDPQKILTTLSFQFAVKDPSYRAYVAQRMATDPTFLDKSLPTQFKDLIIIPFARHQLLSDPAGHIIFLDGLDECRDEREQSRIVDLIHEFILQYPTVPLTWVVASRPEPHIKVSFSRAGARIQNYWEKEIPIDSKESIRDVEFYLHKEFTRIQQSYPDVILSGELWPSEKHFLKICHTALGLFVFASTVIRFIDDPSYGNPVSRLKCVLAIFDKSPQEKGMEANPFQVLDRLYEQIMSDIPSDVLPTTKLLLGFVALLGKFTDISPFFLCNLMGIEHHVLYGALRRLHSVLKFPEMKRAAEGSIRYHHASFLDYLQDQERSNEFHINLPEAGTHIWQRCMTILRQWGKRHSYDDVELSWPSRTDEKGEQSMLFAVPGESGGGFSISVEATKKGLVNRSGMFWIVWLVSFARSVLVPMPLVARDFDLLDFSRVENFGPFVRSLVRLIESVKGGLLDRIGIGETMIQEFSLADLNRKRFLRSLYVRRWFGYQDGNRDFAHLGFKHVLCGCEVGQDTSTESNWVSEKIGNDLSKSNERIAKLIELMATEEAHSITVTVLGAQPSRCCAMVKHNVDDTEIIWTFPYFL